MRIRLRRAGASRRALAVFQECTDAELRAVDAIGTEVQIPAGTQMMREGSAGLQAMIILAGSVEVSRSGSHLAELGAGAIVGEMSLLDGSPRTATVTAKTQVRALVLNAGEFNELLRLAPSAGAAIGRTAAERRVPALKLRTAVRPA